VMTFTPVFFAPAPCPQRSVPTCCTQALGVEVLAPLVGGADRRRPIAALHRHPLPERPLSCIHRPQPPSLAIPPAPAGRLRNGAPKSAIGSGTPSPVSKGPTDVDVPRTVTVARSRPQ